MGEANEALGVLLVDRFGARDSQLRVVAGRRAGRSSSDFWRPGDV
jgi:hypothetical protein